MDWNTLLCETRKRDSTTQDKHRNGFDKDYDRIIPSSSLRRLQDKAQVFPLQSNDFIRTRLTHSIEVSALARSLGILISHRLTQEKGISFDIAAKIPSALMVAGLVHDIGNPPFGHAGENIIQNWFTKWLESKEYCNLVQESEANRLTESQKNDFKYFDGNAQGLRILTKLQFLNDIHGINFTYATLSILLKYPWGSSEAESRENKFGYFTSETDLAQRIQEKTGTNGCRHPLTYLLEAADDIAYLAADVEDGVKKKLIDWDCEYNGRFKEYIEREYNGGYVYLEKMRQQAKDNKVAERQLIDAQNFRIWVQGVMINSVADEFIRSYDSLMEGTYKGELLKNCQAQQFRIDLKDLGKKFCYKSSEALTLELVGDSVINGLLNIFVLPIAKDNSSFDPGNKSGKLYNIISENFRHIQKFDGDGKYDSEKPLNLYDRLLLITDYISGMTDSFAVDCYQKLTGVKLP